MSTSRPPLIFLVTLPETGSPSFLDFMIASQLMMRSALRLLILTRPVSPSTSSRRTLDFVADLDVFRLVEFAAFENAFALEARARRRNRRRRCC